LARWFGVGIWRVFPLIAVSKDRCPRPWEILVSGDLSLGMVLWW